MVVGGQGFETYLKTFPKSDLADDAQYYIGEALAGDSKFKEAVAAYERVVSDYPQSDILPEAYYRSASTSGSGSLTRPRRHAVRRQRTPARPRRARCRSSGSTVSTGEPLRRRSRSRWTRR